jgi:hypothetical protein
MALFRHTPNVSPTELSLRIREQYARVARSQLEEGPTLDDMLRVGPRALSYPDSRSTLGQMNGLLTGRARLQMAFTQLATGAVLLDLMSTEEVQS